MSRTESCGSRKRGRRDRLRHLRPFATTGYAASTLEDLQETARLVAREERRVVARPADVRDFRAVCDLLAEGVAELVMDLGNTAR